jgi:SAM-dependent methyltransferase
MKPTFAESGLQDLPPLQTQKTFWDEWNRTWRFRELDSFMERQREFAVSLAQSRQLRQARILDVGCGTGWLANALLPFGQVWATDLSEGAIAEGSSRHPDVQFVCGDFLTADLPGPFDFIVSADSLINMYDQSACVRRMARLLRPGGTLLLMTPNREVWRRRTVLKPLGRGQVQHWLSLGEYKTLLEPEFTLERVTTLDPGGNSGMLWWVENRYVRGGMSRLVGRRRWRALLEAAGLGRELVFVCAPR